MFLEFEFGYIFRFC